MKRFLFTVIFAASLAASIVAQNTTNLQIPKPRPVDSQWLVNYNSFDKFDAAIAGRLSKSVAGSSNVTLTTTEARNAILEFTGLLTGSINVIVPTKAKLYVIYNNTTGSFTLTVKTSGGSGVAVTQGTRSILYCDATNVVSVVSGGAGASIALDNLASVSINTSLLAQTGVDLGSTTKPFRDLYLFGGGTYGTNYFKFNGTPTSTRTLTIPDRTATLATSSGTLTSGNCAKFDASGNIVDHGSTCGGGSSAWSGLTDPSGNLSLAMAANLTTLTWAGNFSTSSAFKLVGNNTSATGPLFHLTTNASNLIPPLLVEVRGSNQRLKVGHLGDVAIGQGAIGSTDTDGFPYVPTVGSNSFPTSTPTGQTGFAPIVAYSNGINTEYDLAIYLNSGWRSIGGARKRYDTGSGTGAQTLDFNSNAGGVVTREYTATGNSTLTFNNPPPAGSLVVITIIQGGAGSFTITWPASVKWSAGTAPTLTTTAGKRDVFTFLWNGSNYYNTSQQLNQ